MRHKVNKQADIVKRHSWDVLANSSLGQTEGLPRPARPGSGMNYEVKHVVSSEIPPSSFGTLGVEKHEAV